jgi:NAD(P)-dependent dehydrogenase (short-subunit alcohol dehydrogenase family)
VSAKTAGSLDGKICMVTGATSGIGLVTARRLAEHGATVVLVGRDAERGVAALATIRRSAPGAALDALYANLSEHAGVHRLAEAFQARYPRLDVLVNNAGGMFGGRQLSPDGIEMTFALNHLGYFHLTNLLLPALKAAPGARIVNVASRAHQGVKLRFDDLQHERRYIGWLAYKRSKLANLLFTYELARRLSNNNGANGDGLTVNALHPGFVATSIGVRHGFIPGLLWRAASLAAIDVEKGAETSVYLATSPDVRGVTGRYFVKCRARDSSPASYDRDAARRLWDISAEMTGI